MEYKDYYAILGVPQDADAAAVTRHATRAGGDDDAVGDVAMDDDTLPPLDHPADAVTRCLRGDVVQVVARLRLGVREGKQRPAGGDAGHGRGRGRGTRARWQR